MKIIFISIFTFLLSADDINDSEKELPIIDLRKGLVFESKINLQNFFNEDRNAKSGLITNEEIEVIKKNAKKFISSPIKSNEIALLETTHGIMKIKLFDDIAPMNCSNFKKLANSGFYDNTLFHRLIPGFILQGGDILTRDGEDDNDGLGNPGWTVDAEFSNLKHKRGTFSMHRTKNDINSAGSQFFITLSKQKNLDNNYTIIGEIVDGLKVLDVISNIPSKSKIAFRMLKTKIPVGQSDDQWDEIVFNSQQYFIKVPPNVNVENFKNMILNRINNKTKPSVPIRIKKLRVVDDDEKN